MCCFGQPVVLRGWSGRVRVRFGDSGIGKCLYCQTASSASLVPSPEHRVSDLSFTLHGNGRVGSLRKQSGGKKMEVMLNGNIVTFTSHKEEGSLTKLCKPDLTDYEE